MFVVFEGADGCGKSTQLRLCENWLAAEGADCVVCRDPGTTDLGNRVRSILLDHADFEICNRAELLLFMVARAQLVNEVICPALAQNQIVLCDRFLLSTVVYQGYGHDPQQQDSASSVSIDEIYEVGRVATNETFPDLSLVFDLPSEIAESRLGQEKDRMESRGREFFERVRQGFLTESRRSPETIRVIDSSGSIEQIHENVKQQINQLIQECR